MKYFGRILISSLLSVFVLTSCDDLLDVDSDRIITQDEFQMNAANDSLYSMFGIFSKLEKIADSYVLAGELRADLMDVTEESNVYLKELNNLTYSANNPFTNNIRDYYAVVNNCNYVINTVDTTTVKGGKLVMMRVYAAAKAIRAWTYMQIALNFGSASYYENPILTLQDAENVVKKAPELTLEQMAPYLIADLIPYKDVEKLSLGGVYSYTIKNSFFPIRFILGDLYLWTGQYEKAANEYHDLMYLDKLIVSSSYKSYREVSGTAFTGTSYLAWNEIFESGSDEFLTNILASNEYGQVFQLDSLNRKFMLKPSKQANKYWNSQRYYYSDKLDTLGDLRKYGAYNRVALTSDFEYFTDSVLLKYIYLNPETKTTETSRQIMVYRTSLLYLRYAEAVNRLGKPHLALAVLKNGLNSTTLTNRTIVPKWETGTTLPNYMDFTDARFLLNIGIRARGLGNANLDAEYVLPDSASLAAIGTDSTLFVEDLIVQELALETAFEGNRFHDLMRVALRRNDPAYLANRVAAKHPDNEEDIKSRLMTKSNWYLPKP